MATTWIVAGDASRARVLQVMGRNRLEEIQDFVNPKGRMDDRELITDAYPRFRGTGGPGSDRQETSAQEHEVELFAKQIDRFLDQARIKQRYDRLFVLAPPKFLGLLRKNLDKGGRKAGARRDRQGPVVVRREADRPLPEGRRNPRQVPLGATARRRRR